MAPGKEVRLKYGYPITCTDFKTDASGHVTEIRATVSIDEESKVKKIKGTIHWVAEAPGSPEHQPVKVELRLYDHLFTDPDPGSKGKFMV